MIDYALACGVTLSIQAYEDNTTSDHLPILSVISMKLKNKCLGKNTHWKVFSLFTEYTSSFWGKRWNLDNLSMICNEYTQFLFLLSVRCTKHFSFNECRPSIPVEIRSFVSYIRALSFRQMRTKCLDLKTEVIALKRAAKIVLKNFFSLQLESFVRSRNTASPAASYFWSKSKNFIKPSSSSVAAFISPSGHIVKDSGAMCETAADFYECFFSKV